MTRCPVCYCFEVNRLLNDVRITAEVDGTLRSIGGLLLFICQQGHIFFVRQTDVETASLTARSRAA